MKLLFSKLGYKKGGYLTWSEFMSFLVSKECSFFETNTDQLHLLAQSIDPSVLEGVVKVIENEIYGLKELEKLKRKLYRHKYCDWKKIFDLMDVDKKGFLDLRDIFDFMKSEDQRVSYADCERTLRRLDLNGDKKVDFVEFEQVMKPSKIFMDFRDQDLRSIPSENASNCSSSADKFTPVR